jgi:hypothetical protein
MEGIHWLEDNVRLCGMGDDNDFDSALDFAWHFRFLGHNQGMAVLWVEVIMKGLGFSNWGTLGV